MDDLKHIAGEFMSALCVLALVFLSFSHQPAPAIDSTSIEVFQVTSISFCGDGPANEHSGHSPCHACRATIAVLPTPPCVAEPAYAHFITNAFVQGTDLKPITTAPDPYRSRAPPVAI